MLRHTIFFGAIIGSAVAVPFVHQANPALFSRFFSSTPDPQVALVQPNAKTHSAQVSSSATRVEVPMDARGHFVTEFKLNGRRTEALVDTGATYVAINRSLASRIGVKVAQADMKHSVTTANGKAAAAAILVDEIAIGRIRVRNVPALVLEDRALAGVLMGMSFLKELDRFAIENRTLILEN